MMDSPLGIRLIKTLRKLPKTAPKIKIIKGKGIIQPSFLSQL